MFVEPTLQLTDNKSNFTLCLESQSDTENTWQLLSPKLNQCLPSAKRPESISSMSRVVLLSPGWPSSPYDACSRFTKFTSCWVFYGIEFSASLLADFKLLYKLRLHMNFRRKLRDVLVTLDPSPRQMLYHIQLS